MLSIPIAIVVGILYVVFGGERAANIAAHEICPSTHVVRADGEFRFACDGQRYVVRCEGRFRKQCTVEPAR